MQLFSFIGFSYICLEAC